MNTISNKIEIRKSGVCSGQGVFATEKIFPGEVIVDIEAKIVHEPSEYALQISESEFLFENFIDNIINHSCSANCKIQLWADNKRRVSFVALKEIDADQELFWNYNSTEWEQVPIFKCGCNSPHCVKVIRGAKYLRSKQIEEIFPLCTEFIKGKLLELKLLDKTKDGLILLQET